MKATGNKAIDNFIIEASLINPIEDIISKLKNGNFRDCDIKWLDAKLEAFMKFAAKTLYIDLPAKEMSDRRGVVMNDHVTRQYLNYFNGLLKYFKTYTLN